MSEDDTSSMIGIGVLLGALLVLVIGLLTFAASGYSCPHDAYSRDPNALWRNEGGCQIQHDGVWLSLDVYDFLEREGLSVSDCDCLQIVPLGGS